MRWFGRMILLVLMIGLVACAGSTDDVPPPAEEPAAEQGPVLTGTVNDLRISIDGGGDFLGSFALGGQPENDQFADARVTITTATRFFREQGGERVESGMPELRDGQTIELTITGPVMESFPVQANAGEIVILEQ